jgi:hypothetical protein
MQTNTRNATLEDLASMLKEQHARKIDVVAPAGVVSMKDGDLVLKGMEPILNDDGVTDPNGSYRPTSVADEGLAEKLGIPLLYVRRLRHERLDLLDGNVNGWLRGSRVRRTIEIDNAVAGVEQDHGPDPRSFLIRCFRPDDEGGTGIARAFLSDRYAIFDNLDAMTACLDGVRAAGVDVVIDGCDLSDRRMTIRLIAPEVTAMAEELLAGYQNPFRTEIDRWQPIADREGLGFGGSEPVVFAGLVISNSETGDGSFSIAPRITVKVCKNGLTITKDVTRAIHLGGKLDAGVIRWSAETMNKNADLIRAKTADSVRTFLDVEYLRAKISEITEKAGKPIDKPEEQIKIIGKRLSFSEAEIDGVLNHFIRGGQMTAGGVMQAVTSYAQTVQDADAAYDLEAQALRVLEVA